MNINNYTENIPVFPITPDHIDPEIWNYVLSEWRNFVATRPRVNYVKYIMDKMKLEIQHEIDCDIFLSMDRIEQLNSFLQPQTR